MSAQSVTVLRMAFGSAYKKPPEALYARARNVLSQLRDMAVCLASHMDEASQHAGDAYVYSLILVIK